MDGVISVMILTIATMKPMSFVTSWGILQFQGTLDLPRPGIINPTNSLHYHDDSCSYGTDYLPMKWDDVDCSSSSYLSISQCSYSTFIDFGCSNTNSYDATVYCCKFIARPHCNVLQKLLDFTRIWSNPFSGMIRLQGGDFSNQGRVEVYCNGQWGTICNAGFDSSDATTLCRQLGYDGYFTYNHLDL